MTDEDMLTLLNYSLQKDDPKQIELDFKMQVEKHPPLNGGQYLMFGVREYGRLA